MLRRYHVVTVALLSTTYVVACSVMQVVSRVVVCRSYSFLV